MSMHGPQQCVVPPCVDGGGVRVEVGACGGDGGGSGVAVVVIVVIVLILIMVVVAMYCIFFSFLLVGLVAVRFQPCIILSCPFCL